MILEYVLAISAVSEVSSFTSTHNHRLSFIHPQQRLARPTKKTKCIQRPLSSSSSSLSVLIYGWDENDDECIVTDTINDYDMGGTSTTTTTSPTAVCSPVGIALAESLSQNQEKVGTLARLACAFAPSDKALNLQDIEHVHIVCVTETHIEIEAVLCEDHNCVSLFVPIEFPHDCGQNVPDTYLEKCVLDNLQYLDGEAEPVVVKSLEKTNVDSHEDDHPPTTTLLRSVEELLHQDMAYPTWWVSADAKPELAAECDTIRRLLRQDEFQNAVNDLARKGLEALGMADTYKIHQAVVVAVGPAGMCLKAQGSSLRLDSSETASDVILDVPLPFGGGRPHFDAESLRAAVLGEVAACQVL